MALRCPATSNAVGPPPTGWRDGLLRRGRRSTSQSSPRGSGRRPAAARRRCSTSSRAAPCRTRRGSGRRRVEPRRRECGVVGHVADSVSRPGITDLRQTFDERRPSRPGPVVREPRPGSVERRRWRGRRLCRTSACVGCCCRPNQEEITPMSVPTFRRARRARRPRRPLPRRRHRPNRSPSRQAVIPDALAGRDVTGRAPTGSGKTLAFGIPLVANLAPAQRKPPDGARARPDA